MSNDPPGVDLADLFHHEREHRRAACAAIETQLFERGAVTIHNHGVDGLLAGRLGKRFRSFVSGPREAKQRIEAHARGWYQRGWLPSATPPSGTERFRAAPLPLAEATRLDEPEVGAPNVWPDAGFEQDAVQLTQQLHEAALAVLQGLATATGLPPRAFDHRVEGAPHLLELASITETTEPAVGPKLLTLVVQPAGDEANEEEANEEEANEDGDLETAATARVQAFAGQSLEILMGGRVRAKPLPLPEPPTVHTTYSLDLLNLQLLFPFERFRTVHTRLQYGPPVLAQTYRTKTLVDLGLAPAEAVARFGWRDA